MDLAGIKQVIAWRETSTDIEDWLIAEVERLSHELQTDSCCKDCKEVRAARAEGMESMRIEAATTAYRKLYRWGYGSQAAIIERILLELASAPARSTTISPKEPK